MFFVLQYDNYLCTSFLCNKKEKYKNSSWF
nr:MAG TPA: hypothetical protein [Caudoviricetes sp.]